VALLALSCAPRWASAQPAGSTNTGNNIDIEHFRPATSPLGLAVIPEAKGQRWREWSIGLYLHYARNPLVLFQDRLQIGEVVGHRISADLVGSIGLTRWLELGAAIPLVLYQTGDPDLPTGDLASFGLRDVRVNAKITLFTQFQTKILGLAIVPEVKLPTGDTDAFMGDGTPLTFSPYAVADTNIDLAYGLRFAAMIGVRLRPRSEIGNIEVGNELFYRGGAGLGLPAFLGDRTEAIAEIGGTTKVDEPFANAEQNPLTGTAGLRAYFDLEPGHQIIWTAGLAAGATRGYGSPDFQVYTGIIYRRWLSDRDEDGILDDDDYCPDDPEDHDDFEDSDGCPDPDNDKDGIPDVADKCENDPEDFDGFEDLDGCPEPDNDRDGIPDTTDHCPLDPEDIDGFEDDDGCPEEDNDRDGVPDSLDKCSGEKETINGVDDEDGCPDEGEEHVEVTSEKITIDTKIHFDFDSARIKAESFNILDQVALTMKANPQLLKIRIEGHTDSRGTDDYNLLLSQRRAEAVMDYLISKGVKQSRLEAVGYGEQRPLVAGDNDEAWATNRRVEFRILEREGETPETGGREIELPNQAPPPKP
jgi:large repetitive protein